MLIYNYALSHQDYISYYIYVTWDSEENKKKKKSFLLRQIFIVILLIYIYYYVGLFAKIGDLSYFIFAFFIAATIFSFIRIRYNYINIAKKFTLQAANINIFSQKEVIISETGISIKDKLASVVFTWKAFTKKEETEDYYFLFINSIQAVILPKRIIKTDAEKITLNKLFLEYLSFDAEIEHLLKN